jgi:RsmE family RNA methyltransferase
VTAADRLIAIGPEGGWTPDELALAEDLVSLGDTVLRVETAALVACVEIARWND